jgi:hypothetical protein
LGKFAIIAYRKQSTPKSHALKFCHVGMMLNKVKECKVVPMHTMEAHGSAEVQLHSSLTLAFGWI